MLLVYKSRGSPFAPLYLCMGSQSRAHGHTKQGRGGMPEHKTTKATPRPETQRARGRGGLPRQDPCRGGLRSPGKSLAGATCPTPAERATLEPKGSNAINHIGTKAREAPPWWHADLREDHKHTRSDEDQKTTILGKILAEEIHETSGKILAGDDRDVTARPLPGPRQDPCRGHQRGRGQAHICQDSTAVPMQLPAQPARRAPAWRRAASRPTQQAPAWWHADLREDTATAPAQQPASLHGAACLVGLDACRSKAKRRRTGRASLPSPIKQEDT